MPWVIVLTPVIATNYCHLTVALSIAADEVELAVAATVRCSLHTPCHLQVLEQGG